MTKKQCPLGNKALQQFADAVSYVLQQTGATPKATMQGGSLALTVK